MCMFVYFEAQKSLNVQILCNFSGAKITVLPVDVMILTCILAVNIVRYCRVTAIMDGDVNMMDKLMQQPLFTKISWKILYSTAKTSVGVVKAQRRPISSLS